MDLDSFQHASQASIRPFDLVWATTLPPEMSIEERRILQSTYLLFKLKPDLVTTAVASRAGPSPQLLDDQIAMPRRAIHQQL